MKNSICKLIIIAAISSICGGCATKPQIWVLKNSETALMDYVAIVPVKTPEGNNVANLFGENEGRKYQVPMTNAFLNAYIRKLLEGKDNKLSVQEGNFVIRNINGGKLQVGGGFTSNDGENVSVERNGGVYLGDNQRSGGLVTTLLGWIF